MIDTVLVSRVQALSVIDRLELMAAIWNTLSPIEVPVTTQDQSLLDIRLVDLENNPQEQSSWSEVRERLERALP